MKAPGYLFVQENCKNFHLMMKYFRIMNNSLYSIYWLQKLVCYGMFLKSGSHLHLSPVLYNSVLFFIPCFKSKGQQLFTVFLGVCWVAQTSQSNIATQQRNLYLNTYYLKNTTTQFHGNSLSLFSCVLPMTPISSRVRGEGVKVQKASEPSFYNRNIE